MTSCYKTISQAKDGTLVPVFQNGQPMFSLYNPARDAETFAAVSGNPGFVVVCGIGNGMHINALLRKFPRIIIIAVENSRQDIDFLLKKCNLQDLQDNPSVILITQDMLEQTLVNTYNPTLHGDFLLLPVRAWKNNNSDCFEKIRQTVQIALNAIGADTTTQQHFGKIWHRNILINLQTAPLYTLDAGLPNPGNYTGAFVAAAGPSLEKTLPALKKKLIAEHWYIIATDTSLPALLRNGLQPDMTVTIDGQQCSSLHFYCRSTAKMIVAADFCANPTVLRTVHLAGCPVVFFTGRHPLCTLISQYFADQQWDSIPTVYTGSGTVTIAAVDMAIKLGFSVIRYGGADFCYYNRKPYTKGTYFDDSFNNIDNRLFTTEQQYIQLMYRSPVHKNSAGQLTSDLLETYSESFKQYETCHSQLSIKELTSDNDKIMSGSVPAVSGSFTLFKPTEFQSNKFIQWYLDALRRKDKNVIPSILPLFTWFNGKNGLKTDFFSFIKLAYSESVRYTNIYGK